MKTHVKVIYGISLALAIFMLALFSKYESSDEYIAREEVECSILTDYEMASYENKSAPIGLTQEYKWILNDVPKRGGAVAFYVIHQEIEIYIDNELIYSLTASEDNLFSKTVGCDWAKAYLYPEDEGKEIRILVHPIYETSIANELTIYYGNFDIICDQIIQNNMPVLIMGIISIVIGICFIGFVLVNLKNHEFDTSIAFLGIFSLFAGLWKVSDMSSAPLLFKDSITLSALAIIALSMMMVPYIFYIRNQFARTKHKFWDFLCISFSIGTIIIVLLQLLGIADLRQTLTLCHVMAITEVTSIMVMLLRETRHKKLSGKIKATLICCILCLIGTVIDMVMFYISGNSGSMIYCLLAFLIYVIAMGYMSLREALKLIEQGKEARRFEQLALHDELTGLYNRAYYAQYLKKHNVQQSDCFIIMFDVNNLKKCNDTIGHDCGDHLLQNSARILEQSFQPAGKCIRMGGDEFCVILRHISEKDCQTCLRRFDALLKDFNAAHPSDFPVEIAYGYANYDDEEDFDFGDTLRRADKEMYQMKMNMKTHA